MSNKLDNLRKSSDNEWDDVLNIGKHEKLENKVNKYPNIDKLAYE